MVWTVTGGGSCIGRAKAGSAPPDVGAKRAVEKARPTHPQAAESWQLHPSTSTESGEPAPRRSEHRLPDQTPQQGAYRPSGPRAITCWS